ncbi:hypothetical protein DPEC_G00090730 [Dallia pectoralis]|uniref:Uncharacterized protein n=1 Tax=Dallia pectoralis TaxID=75939 RepID=A0ACC2H0Q9_DALPE|nr:hypothetical protein DPEC_G00090730 [Dallia pectoralis]
MSSRVFNPRTHMYSNVAEANVHGYGPMPVAEEILASHLSPAASSLRTPALPSKALKTTSALVGKAYSAAGQAASCLHTMSILQAYQAELLSDGAQGETVSPDEVRELRQAADLSLRATKETAKSVGRAMAALVATERHLWLSLSDMRDREKAFLLDAPLSPDGLFGPAIGSVVERFQEERRQAAAFQKFLPRRSRVAGAVGRGQPRPAPSTAHRAQQRVSVATRTPPHDEWARRRRSQAFEGGVVSSSWCPQRGGLGERFPEGRSPPPRRGPELSDQLFPASALLQGTVSAVPVTPEASLERLVPLVDFLAEWKTLPNISQWVLRIIESGYAIQFRTHPPRFNGVLPTVVGPEQALVLEQETVGRLSFKMLTLKQIVSQIRSEDWFVTIDLKDAYFHISILPQHRKFLRFAFGGEAYQYRVLPFGLALSPRTFTRCIDAALAPLRLQGIRILNYIDDWLILAPSEHLAVRHRDVVLAHINKLGLRLNAGKSVLSPVQVTTFLGVVWDSTTMRAHLSPARVASILAAVEQVRLGQSLTVKQFQRLLGLLAAASNVIPCGLLFMRPLQWWLRTKGFSPRGNQFRMITVTRRCLRTLVMWRKPWFLTQGPVLGAPCRRVTLTLTGWGAIMSGRPAQGLWRGHQLSWHINWLEMLAVYQALKHFLPDLRGHHVLVRSDNTSVVFYINHQGGLRSRPLYNLARQVLLWSHGKLLSLRAIFIPGYLNQGADTLSRQGPRPGERRLHPEVVELLWSHFGRAEVDLFASRETSHCPLWFSLTHPAPLGLDAMVQAWPRSRLYAFPPVALLPGVLERIRQEREGPAFPGAWGHPSPPPGAVETMGLASEGARLLVSGLSTEVVETILHSRAPATRKAYAARWKLFTSWCRERQVDPVNCPVFAVLEFLQHRFSTGLSPSTLKVYVAALSACHVPLNGVSLGRHPLVSRFLRGARRLRPAAGMRVPSWDLAIVLEGLSRAPFEPIEEVPDKFVTLKTVFLLAISSLKRIGDMQALSVAPSCLDFSPGMVKAFLLPSPGALDAYVHRTALWRLSEQLFVCFGPPKRGGPVSKQRMSKWVVEAISLAYESAGQPSPLAVRAHSTRSMAASKALLSGKVSLHDVCVAAGWSSPHLFVRFYQLDFSSTPGAQVLSSECAL